jgi:hypothetical protein
MPSRKSTKNRNIRKAKTRKQLHNIENAVARAEGKQSLLRFGHTGQDKFKEERQEHDWLNNVGDKHLQKLINQHYYKYDSKKVKLGVRQPITFLFPTKTRRRR